MDVWTALALGFNGAIYFWHGQEKAVEFLAGYLVELSLSIDNLFVFLLLFAHFKVPDRYQHKVLFWGVFGALLMRAVFVAAGVALVTKFHWIMYVFGLLLVVSGIKMAFDKDKEIHPENSPVFKLARRAMRLTRDYHEDRFFVRLEGQMFATPLFVVVLLIEASDLVFAVDSVPAVLAITTDPFIVYTSNVFAILGLRSMFFALAGIMILFEYLHYGLSAVLVFVGAKMLLADYWHISTPVSLGVIVILLVAAVVASLIWRPRASA